MQVPTHESDSRCLVGSDSDTSAEGGNIYLGEGNL